ncbi:MAG: PKD domain-containing protein, partial [Flavobacteriales bacterium]
MTATVSFEAETTNGCIGSASTTVYIKPQPTADFTVDVNTGCSPLAVQFNNVSTQADEFTWDFGNGTSVDASNPTHVFETGAVTTSFEVTLTATDALGCSSTTTREITAFPAADFALALTSDSVCSPLELTLPTVPGGQNITWNFGDGNTATGQNPQHSWANNSGELMTALV